MYFHVAVIVDYVMCRYLSWDHISGIGGVAKSLLVMTASVRVLLFPSFFFVVFFFFFLFFLRRRCVAGAGGSKRRYAVGIVGEGMNEERNKVSYGVQL